MNHILDNLSIANVLTNTTDVLSAVGPYLELLAGLLLAFLAVGYLVSILSKKKE